MQLSTKIMARLIELIVVVIVSLSCIEACVYDFECSNVHEEDSYDLQCCNGLCVDNNSLCSSTKVKLAIAVFMGVVICTIACCCCCSLFPEHRYPVRLSRTIIIRSNPPYEKFTSDPTVTDATKPGYGRFYPQYVALQNRYLMQRPTYIPDQPYPLWQPGDKRRYPTPDAENTLRLFAQRLQTEDVNLKKVDLNRDENRV